MSRYYSAKEFSKEFNPPMPMQTVWKMMREQMIPVKVVGKKKFVDMDEFEKTTGNELADKLLEL